MKELFEAARKAREHSYSPYSGHKVGSAFRTKDGKIYAGCNVENSSYGATICAERTAVSKAVSECGQIEITELLVITDASPAWPPCGLCRQVVSEFARPETKVYLANLKGVERTLQFKDLMPDAFTPAHLGK